VRPAARLTAVVLAACFLVPSLCRAQDKSWSNEKLRMTGDRALIDDVEIPWLKIYSLSPVEEVWTMNLEVKNLPKKLEKVLAAFKKNGAVLDRAIKYFPRTFTEQQLSYQVSREGGKKIQKRLSKIGRLGKLRVRRKIPRGVRAEALDKLVKLRTERDLHARELAGMPVISKIVHELIVHLAIVEAVRAQTQSKVKINITIRERH